VSADWKHALLPGGANGRLPDGYRREGGIVGRAELMDATGEGLWLESRFVARSQAPHTTSAVEARIRRRHLESLVEAAPIDPNEPLLDLGCADGTLEHALLDLGFEKVVSTDVVHPSVARLDRSLAPAHRERVLLVVDDLFRLPLAESSFSTVIAWGVLSVSGDFDRALELAWRWVAPGGHMILAEPTLEQALVYALVRGDLGEFRRTLTERTRWAMWDKREDRYPLAPVSHYDECLSRLPGATVAKAGGVNMLPSLILGSLVQTSPIGESELAEVAELLGDPALDELLLWRQAFWLVRKA
jgi:SAM-dependent methyltransferase